MPVSLQIVTFHGVLFVIASLALCLSFQSQVLQIVHSLLRKLCIWLHKSTSCDVVMLDNALLTTYPCVEACKTVGFVFVRLKHLPDHLQAEDDSCYLFLLHPCQVTIEP